MATATLFRCRTGDGMSLTVTAATSEIAARCAALDYLSSAGRLPETVTVRGEREETYLIDRDRGFQSVVVPIATLT